MALTDNFQTWLTGFCEHVGDNPGEFTDFERNFIADQDKRLLEFGAHTRFSVKQYQVIERAARKAQYPMPPSYVEIYCRG